jgi:hypothetical protein
VCIEIISTLSTAISYVIDISKLADIPKSYFGSDATVRIVETQDMTISCIDTNGVETAILISGH